MCKNLNLPLQPHISVVFHKKATVKEKLTGRIIEYKPSNLHPEPVVMINQATVLTSPLFGYIQSIFTILLQLLSNLNAWVTMLVVLYASVILAFVESKYIH